MLSRSAWLSAISGPHSILGVILHLNLGVHQEEKDKDQVPGLHESPNSLSQQRLPKGSNALSGYDFTKTLVYKLSTVRYVCCCSVGLHIYIYIYPAARSTYACI